jgi:hypothetical protein
MFAVLFEVIGDTGYWRRNSTIHYDSDRLTYDCSRGKQKFVLIVIELGLDEAADYKPLVTIHDTRPVGFHSG